MEKSNNYLVGIIVIMLSMMGCKDNILEKKEEYPISRIDSAIVDFEFKDTVVINNKSKGSLKYNLLLDSIDRKKIDSRYTFLYLTTEPGINSLEGMEKVDHEIFIDTIGDGTFNFHAIFTKQGRNQLNGIIEDKIILNETTENDSVPILGRETRFEWPVYVVLAKRSEF